MTGEQFHDALTLLPEDLIAKADQARSRKPKIIHWRRYASLVACCALLVLCGVLYQNRQAKSTSNEMAKSSAADAAPEMAAQAPRSGDTGAVPSDARKAVPVCLEVPNLSDAAADTAFPEAALFDSREALDERLSEIGEYYAVFGLETACESFDGDFFASQDLLLIFSQDVTGLCEFQDIAWTEGGCTVSIVIHADGGKLTNFATLIPAPKGEIAPENVDVVYITDANP